MNHPLDYLDYDVSWLVGQFTASKKQFNQVVQELDYHIELNIHVIYLESFESIIWYKKHHPAETFDTYIKDLSKHLMDKNRKPRFLSNWPTKQPSAGPISKQGFVRSHRDIYMQRFPESTPWFYKQYPPNKDYYVLDRLKL